LAGFPRHLSHHAERHECRLASKTACPTSRPKSFVMRVTSPFEPDRVQENAVRFAVQPPGRIDIEREFQRPGLRDPALRNDPAILLAASEREAWRVEIPPTDADHERHRPP